MFANVVVLLAALASAKCASNITNNLVSDLQQSDGKDGLSIEIHRKIYSYTKNAKAFKNLTFEETMAFMNDLYAWEAPLDIRENFPYSLWGYDFERRPVWIHEVGRQDWRSVVEQGDERVTILEKYFVKCLIHVVKSLAAADRPGEEIRQGVYVWDLEGFSMRQLGHIPTVASLVGWAVKYGDLPLDLVAKVFIINSNYVTKLAVDIARPLLGRLLEKVEVYGTNRNSWLPRLLKIAPDDIIPPWYGGSKGAKPLAVYG